MKGLLAALLFSAMFLSASAHATCQEGCGIAYGVCSDGCRNTLQGQSCLDKCEATRLNCVKGCPGGGASYDDGAHPRKTIFPLLGGSARPDQRLMR